MEVSMKYLVLSGLSRAQYTKPEMYIPKEPSDFCVADGILTRDHSKGRFCAQVYIQAIFLLELYKLRTDYTSMQVIELVTLRHLQTQNCGPSCDNSSLFFVPPSGQLIVPLFCRTHGFVSISYVMQKIG